MTSNRYDLNGSNSTRIGNRVVCMISDLGNFDLSKLKIGNHAVCMISDLSSYEVEAGNHVSCMISDFKVVTTQNRKSCTLHDFRFFSGAC